MRREKPSKKQHKGRFFKTKVALLAVSAVAAAELTLCYFIDRPIFNKIATQVGNTAGKIGKGGAALIQDGSEALQSLFSQRATEPLLDPPEQEQQAPAENFSIVGGREILVGGATPLVYFAQSDPIWKDKPYGTDNIGDYGCGPTAMAMVVATLTEQQADPAQMAMLASDLGYWAQGSGSYHSIVQGLCDYYGLVCTPAASLDARDVKLSLMGGKLAVALVEQGHFTQSGHFIVLRGLSADGKILVADPNSRERSVIPWDAELVCSELAQSRSSGAPLWYISKKE